jgi:hypothetical protein
MVARKRSGSIGTYGELPDLKFLRGVSLVVGLDDSDFIQKAIRSAVLGNVLRAVAVENVAVGAWLDAREWATADHRRQQRK